MASVRLLLQQDIERAQASPSDFSLFLVATSTSQVRAVRTLSRAVASIALFWSHTPLVSIGASGLLCWTSFWRSSAVRLPTLTIRPTCCPRSTAGSALCRRGRPLPPKSVCMLLTTHSGSGRSSSATTARWRFLFRSCRPHHLMTGQFRHRSASIRCSSRCTTNGSAISAWTGCRQRSDGKCIETFSVGLGGSSAMRC